MSTSRLYKCKHLSVFAVLSSSPPTKERDKKGMQKVSIDYVVGSHRKREDNSMMIFMDRIGQEDEERKFAVMMDDIRWDEDQG